MVYLYYIWCLRYTILVGNPQFHLWGMKTSSASMLTHYTFWTIFVKVQTTHFFSVSKQPFITIFSFTLLILFFSFKTTSHHDIFIHTFDSVFQFQNNHTSWYFHLHFWFCLQMVTTIIWLLVKVLKLIFINSKLSPAPCKLKQKTHFFVSIRWEHLLTKNDSSYSRWWKSARSVILVRAASILWEEVTFALYAPSNHFF